MENKTDDCVNEPTPGTGNGQPVKTASQLKKDAKKLEKLEKFKKKNEAKEAAKKNQSEVRIFSSSR